MNLEAYACYNKHINSRQKSSSGGVYTLLAEAVLRDKGIVFAVCYDENFEAVHREIHTLELVKV